jgi:hypothetical protein
MNSVQFSYWLQGFFELSNADKLTAEQIKIIRNHMNLVKTCMKPKSKVKDKDDSDLSFDLPELDMFPQRTPDGETLLTC